MSWELQTTSNNVVVTPAYQVAPFPLAGDGNDADHPWRKIPGEGSSGSVGMHYGTAFRDMFSGNAGDAEFRLIRFGFAIENLASVGPVEGVRAALAIDVRPTQN